MADNLKQRGGQDRTQIDVGQEHEPRHRSARFGVSNERLKQAVEAVGTQTDKVERHLRAGADRKPAKRASEKAG